MKSRKQKEAAQERGQGSCTFSVGEGISQPCYPTIFSLRDAKDGMWDSLDVEHLLCHGAMMERKQYPEQFSTNLNLYIPAQHLLSESTSEQWHHLW